MKEITPIKVACVVSQFNRQITEALLTEAVAYFDSVTSSKDKCETFWVPGAVEIPLAAQILAKTATYSAIVCLGAVVHGETDHYDYVCKQVSDGCQRVALDFDIPVIFGILTTHNMEQALARTRGTEKNRGREAMQAALEMIDTLAKIKNNS